MLYVQPQYSVMTAKTQLVVYHHQPGVRCYAIFTGLLGIG
jgi:hypothetical protein